MASKNNIWQAALATCAAPTFFEPHQIGHETHLDGGMGFNNPAKIAYKDVTDRLPCPPKVIISIGTGQKPVKSVITRKDQLGEIMRTPDARRQRVKKLLELLIKHSKDWLTDVEEVDDDVDFMAKQAGCKYKRLYVPNTIQEVGHCLGEIPLDDWRPRKGGQVTLERIQRMTNQYLTQRDTDRVLDKYARKLVLIRRQRARTERWERYAMDVTYRCCADENCNRQLDLKNRPTMRRHLDENHPDLTRSKSPQQVESTLNECRVYIQTATGVDASAPRRKITNRAR
jgi:hypothetical protein